VIIVGLGANLVHPEHGSPRQTCEAALAALGAGDVRILRRSRWYESAPVPQSDQPWFINGVAELATGLDAAALLAYLHRVEADFGRVRRSVNEARLLDLDLLAYGRLVSGPGEVPLVPHPRLGERAFVVLPLADLAPDWRHPDSGLSADELASRLPPGQTARPIES